MDFTYVITNLPLILLVFYELEILLVLENI